MSALTSTVRLCSCPATINFTGPHSIAYYLIAAVAAQIDCFGTNSCSRSRELYNKSSNTNMADFKSTTTYHYKTLSK